MYKAHINEETGAVQTVKEHSENTARLCSEFAIPELKPLLYVIGLLHDIGKYQSDFQRRIDGANIRIEHSICGAIEAMHYYKSAVGLLMSYCIAGHHAGIPDGGTDEKAENSTLCSRLNRQTQEYGVFQEELIIPPLDERKIAKYFLRDCGESRELWADKFAFLTRYCFSCLVDADSLDTANFCNGEENRHLPSDFQACLDKVNVRLRGFTCTTTLQRNRALLQQQAFDKAGRDAEIYLMNMPTGSGKTLCSVKFALERAVRTGKKHIIYIIPYNSIIDQTADTFDELFGDSARILRHQSTFSYEDKPDLDEDYRQTAKLATENWDADFVITTAVQFFESIYGNKRGKLRKLHNMADSILIFDEAHLMPRAYLQPCLEAIAYITRYLHSEAVFLTATMPDFRKLLTEYTFQDSRIIDLVEDTSTFSVFQKCSYQDLGEQMAEAVVAKAQDCPSSLVVVNTRAVARKLYALCCRGKAYHLSTYMTAYDRNRIITEIKRELKKLEEDYPDLAQVPEERRIIVVSTSLIEAGVDLDFHTVFRELTGLDSILQSGGRCNREGKREIADVFIFRLEGSKIASDERGNLTKGLLAEYNDISCMESIRVYYERLFFIRKEELTRHAMYRYSTNIKSLPFKEYASEFELIDSKTISIVVARDENSRKMVEKLRATGMGSERKLQKYACTVYRNEWESLLKQHAADDFGSGIWCLTNLDYYDEKTGIQFEACDYII